MGRSNNGENVSVVEKLIGERIGIERSKRRETQEQLANAIGTSKQIVAHWEGGTRHIKADSIVNLCRHFECTADYLLGLEDSPTRDGDVGRMCRETGLDVEVVEWLSAEKARFENEESAVLSGKTGNISCPSPASFLNYLVKYAPNDFQTIQNAVYAAIHHFLLENDDETENRLLNFAEKNRDLVEQFEALGGRIVTDRTQCREAVEFATKRIRNVMNGYIQWIGSALLSNALIGLARRSGATNDDVLKLFETIRRVNGGNKNG